MGSEKYVRACELINAALRGESERETETESVSEGDGEREKAVRGNADKVLAGLYLCNASNLALYKELITLRTDIAVEQEGEIDHFLTDRESEREVKRDTERERVQGDSMRPGAMAKDFLSSSKALRYRGERKGELISIERELFGMSSVFRRPLWHLREQYHTLDREGDNR
jgi:hypothetical protein